MILLTCAVGRELEFWSARAGVELLITGVGPVEAACSIAHALATQRYRLLVNAGVAGAFDGRAAVGDGVAVLDDLLELDLETGEPLTLPGGKRVVDRAHSDLRLVADLRARGFDALHAVTVSRVTSSEATAERLARLGAQVESMEGFAALRAAERAGVPAIQVRGISNRVGARERSGWNMQAGVAGLQRIVTALFDSLGVLDGGQA